MDSLLLDYFNCAAHRYVDIEPAYGPLADGLIGFAKLQPGDRVLDVGTGSGLAARGSVRAGCTAFAVDYSRAMLGVAKSQGVGNLLQSDTHDLALRSSTFDVVLASFALNSTDPTRCLSEARRVLAPGGRVALQEWGAPDPLTVLVWDTIADYAVEEPPPELAAVRAAVEAPVLWDDIEGPDDVVAIMVETGFCDVEMEVVRPAVVLPDVDVFMRYKLAWPDRHAEIDAMPMEIRQLCLGDLQENLAAHVEEDGSMIWQPEIFRVCGRRPL
ncbi:MAG: methyltransferase domain-containing protein [Anaerolineae bacterium]|nr:methyltransferase domain-containing protein [Anaerolineae bacterium]